MVDTHGVGVGPLSVTPGNQHAPVLLPDTLPALVACTTQSGIALLGSAMPVEAGCDSQATQARLTAHPMPPVSSPNRRTPKTPLALARMCRWCERPLYRRRDKVERPFGGEDTLRQRVIRSDRLPAMRTGCRLWADAMIHCRTTCTTS